MLGSECFKELARVRGRIQAAVPWCLALARLAGRMASIVLKIHEYSSHAREALTISSHKFEALRVQSVQKEDAFQGDTVPRVNLDAHCL